MSAAHDDIRDKLLDWFDANARQMPWRGIGDPYGILVSEIMLQQTRVETVRDYWTRWMAAFPTIQALAGATQDEVIAQWSGLGYYRRARNLHAAANVVVAELGGSFPETFDALRELPGVGPYTAGAVASIAFGEVVPAVDGNVIRVTSRLFTIDGQPERVAFKRAVQEHAEALVDAARPGDSNQAVMELGAIVCTARSPSCLLCPVAETCEARAAGATADYPPPKRKTKVRKEGRVTIVPVAASRCFVRRRPDEGLLASTWEFPTTHHDELEEALRELEERHGITGVARAVGDVEHVFSHIEMTYRVWRLDVDTESVDESLWVDSSELTSIGLSTAMRKVADAALTSLEPAPSR